MAQTAEVSAEIEHLAIHCRPPLLEPAQRAVWLADWCEDLGSFRIEDIRAGCAKWRQGADRRFPSAGQLVPLILDASHQRRVEAPVLRGQATASDVRQAIVADMGEAFAHSYFDRSTFDSDGALIPWSGIAEVRLRERAAGVLSRLGIKLGQRPKPQASPEPGRQMAEDDYQRLGLNEKIRHHEILATKALDRAGPMWRNGQACKAEDLPDEWRDWRLRAENHTTEAARLRGLVKRSDKFA